jgi:hypothetical protein
MELFAFVLGVLVGVGSVTSAWAHRGGSWTRGLLLILAGVALGRSADPHLRTGQGQKPRAR